MNERTNDCSVEAVCWPCARPGRLKISVDPPGFPTGRRCPCAHCTDEASETERHVGRGPPFGGDWGALLLPISRP